MKFAAGFFILGIAASACVLADTYYVDDDGPADNNIQIASVALDDIIIYPNIQAAIDDSNDGDTIIVMPGTYKGDGNKNIDFMGRAITLRSKDPNDPNIVASTIIDCEGFGRGFYFYSQEDYNSVLAGFTVVNGDVTESWEPDGGGIYCNNSSPMIRNCVISNNQSDNGGGIFCFSSNAIIENCIIDDNNGLQQGGGIYCEGGDITILGCKVDNNYSFGNGGGIYGNDGDIEVDRCIVSRNRSDNFGGGIKYDGGKIKDCIVACNKACVYGGGIYCSVPEIFNCTIVNNTVAEGIGGGLYCSSSGNLLNSILWSNTSAIEEFNQLKGDGRYCCIQDEDPNDVNIPDGFGNIDDYPQFLRDPNDGGDGFGDDPNTPGIDEGANDDLGDLHLKNNSPCINAGLPNYITGPNKFDIDEQPRIIGGRVDMGADEYALMIAVIVPQGGEVWAADSNHTIVWTSYDVGQNVDIQLSDNNGVDWDVVAEDVNNDGGFLLNLPQAVDSNQCVVKVVPAVPDENVACIQSGMFTIQPYNPDEPMASKWQTLGKDYYRRGLSDFNGPELGCVKWVFDTNGPVTTGVAVGDEAQVYAACRDGNLYAIDVNGNLLWTYDANTPLLSTPSIGRDGTVYVGGENGLLYAIDKNGNLRWTHTTGASVLASPAVSIDGKVFAASQDGKLYALAPDGSELWEYETAGYGKNTKGSIIASPAIDANGVVYIAGLYDPNLYALDTNDDGSVRWKVIIKEFDPNENSLQGSIVSVVIGQDGTLYTFFTGDPNLYAVEPDDGSVRWAINLADTESELLGPEYLEKVYERQSQTVWRYGKWYGSECLSEPVTGPDGTIYVSFDDPYLRAVSSDGMVKWVTRLGMVGGFTMGLGNNGMIFAASEDGYLCVVDVNGVEKSRFIVDDWLSYPVIVGDNVLIVSDSNNKIWAIGGNECGEGLLQLHRPADLYGDGIVNFKDFAVFAKRWLELTNKFMGIKIEGCEGWYYTAGESPFGSFPYYIYYEGDEIYFESDLDRNLYVDGFDFFDFIDNWYAEDYRPNKAPEIKIIIPKDEDWFFRDFAPYCVLRIEADAEDEDGQVVKVEFFINGEKIGEDTDGSDGWWWQNDEPLFYSMVRGPQWACISVKAMDDQGAISLAVIQVVIHF